MSSTIIPDQPTLTMAQKAPRKAYNRPAIVIEFDLETRAASGDRPIGGDVPPDFNDDPLSQFKQLQ